MSWPRRRSRSGCARTRPSSSPTTLPWRPESSSTSIRASTQREPQLGEPRDLGLRERLVREVREGWPAPEPEGILEPPVGDELLKPLDVELAGFDAKLVAGRAREDPVSSDRLAELRDVDLQCLGRRPRRPLPPEGLDRARPSRQHGSRSGGERRAGRAASAHRASIARPLSRTSSGPRMRNST